MVAIRHWLKANSNGEQQQYERHGEPRTPDGSRDRVGKQDSKGSKHDVPIFCTGGCGEVVGYLPKGELLAYKGQGYEQWCPACQAADTARERFAKASGASTDSELAELSRPARNLNRLRLMQAATVALIIAGSVFIAMGHVVGIYLAAIGTLAWFGLSFVLWSLRE
jgi:hypothetical protein